MTDERNPQLDEVQGTIQNFVNSVSTAPRFVQDAIVVYETIRYDDQNRPMRIVEYSIITENTSLAAAAGLAHLGSRYIDRDLYGFSADPRDEDDE